MEKITPELARQMTLFAQGLYRSPRKPAAKRDVKDTITSLGVIQIDTINIVARSPYFTFWSRLGAYDPKWLDQSLEEKLIFEYWAHAASFLPIEDFALHRRLTVERLNQSWFQSWYDSHREECDAVLKHIRENGPAKSADFERKDGKTGTWWNWKTEKRALEHWFAVGELMISKRVNFQRVYDLTSRIMPDWKDGDAPDLESVYRSLTLKSIAALGVVLPGWVANYFRLPKIEVNKVFDQLVSQRRLLEIQIEGWNETTWCLPEVWESFAKTRKHFIQPDAICLLPPFDSLIWDRARTRKLFNFDYSIECYLPAHKRTFGYFVLPILHRGNLIGRLDAKAHRAEGYFEVINLYLENNLQVDQNLADDLLGVLHQFADWHNTPRVIIRRSNSERLMELLPVTRIPPGMD